jgi:hypothetical protein
MPYYPYTHNPIPPGPVDWMGVVILFVVLAAIVGAAAGIAFWRERHHGDQHRHSHQH